MADSVDAVERDYDSEIVALYQKYSTDIVGAVDFDATLLRTLLEHIGIGRGINVATGEKLVAEKGYAESGEGTATRSGDLARRVIDVYGNADAQYPQEALDYARSTPSAQPEGEQEYFARVARERNTQNPS